MDSAVQPEVEFMMQQKQIMENLNETHTLIERCFFTCATEFHTSQLTSQERLCGHRCVDKYLRTQLRIGVRFAEQMALQEKEVRAKAEDMLEQQNR
jgi:mitochondrial import inner membrane translocase subunit TIM9